MELFVFCLFVTHLKVTIYLFIMLLYYIICFIVVRIEGMVFQREGVQRCCLKEYTSYAMYYFFNKFNTNNQIMFYTTSHSFFKQYCFLCCLYMNLTTLSPTVPPSSVYVIRQNCIRVGSAYCLW